MVSFESIHHHQVHEHHLMMAYFVGLVMVAAFIVASLGTLLW